MSDRWWHATQVTLDPTVFLRFPRPSRTLSVPPNCNTEFLRFPLPSRDSERATQLQWFIEDSERATQLQWLVIYCP